MTRGTTPSIIATTDIDLTSYSVVWLTIKDSAGTEVTIDTTGLVISPTQISGTMTQEQTLSLAPGIVSIQIRALTSSGVAIASNIMHVGLEQILKDGEIHA